MIKFVSACLVTIGLATLLNSCSETGPQGQLTGKKSTVQNGQGSDPIGMAWVPSGVMRMGVNDQDIRTANDAKTRTVNMFGFFMDATEITNAEYRQFTDNVRDSIAHEVLGDKRSLPSGEEIIDYRKAIKWNSEDVQEQLASYYISNPDETVWGRKEFNNREKLVYAYSRLDYDALARSPEGTSRAKFVKKYAPQIYPDTTVWVKMFTYAYNEPIAHQYNCHKSFDEYPVVGVTWQQAMAFCHWRTILWRHSKYAKKQYLEGEFRLPTETEWEWAARGGHQQSPYPWGGPYLVNKKGCYMANFKPNRGNYSADGGLYTVKAGAYHPNDYGLYNMSGNVSEWTITPYIANAYGAAADLSPDIRFRSSDTDPLYYKRRVLRGGSWKDVAYYLQVSTRDWEFEDTAKAYIGFRCIYPKMESAVTNRPPVLPKR
jgi:formylglycine-generating enzyme